MRNAKPPVPNFDEVLAEFGLGGEEYDSITIDELRIRD